MRTCHKPGLVPAIVLAITLFSASIVVAKTELITNGTFDTDVSNWYDTTSGSISWSSSEGHGATGAAYIQNTYSGGTYSAGGKQCVNLPTPVAGYYTVAGWIKVPSQSNNSAQGYIRFHFYSNTDCSNEIGSDRDTSFVSMGEDWTKVSKTGSTSYGAQSVQVRLLVKKSGAESAYAYFDDISFFPSNANAVTVSAFTAKAEPAIGLAAWPSIAVAGVATAGFGALLWTRRRSRTS